MRYRIDLTGMDRPSVDAILDGLSELQHKRVHLLYDAILQSARAQIAAQDEAARKAAEDQKAQEPANAAKAPRPRRKKGG